MHLGPHRVGTNNTELEIDSPKLTYLNGSIVFTFTRKAKTGFHHLTADQDINFIAAVGNIPENDFINNLHHHSHRIRDVV